MCFTVHKDYPNQLIAETDIKCYKFLQPSRSNSYKIISPIQHAIYFKNILHRKITKKISEFGIENNRYHGIEINEGLHSYSEPKIGYYKAIIPKGTPYYYDPRADEYVSLVLKVYRKKYKMYADENFI